MNDNSEFSLVRVFIFLVGLGLYAAFLFLVIADVDIESVPWLPTMLLGAGMTAYGSGVFLQEGGRRQRVQWTVLILLVVIGFGGAYIRKQINEKDHQELLESLHMTEQEYNAFMKKHSSAKPAATAKPSPTPRPTKAPAAPYTAPKATKKPSTGSSGSAGKGVKGYTNFDDFYDDHYDDFWDIDEAEEYYYEHGGW